MIEILGVVCRLGVLPPKHRSTNRTEEKIQFDKG